MESVSGEISLLCQLPPPPPPHTHTQTHTHTHTKYFVVNLLQKTEAFTPFDHLAESDLTQSDFCYDIVHLHMC